MKPGSYWQLVGPFSTSREKPSLSPGTWSFCCGSDHQSHRVGFW